MKKIVKVILIIPLVALAIALFGWVTMSLWNWLVPELFGGPAVTFWQALGLLVLSKILFSGFGKGGGYYRGHWKGNWKKRLGHMSPEERAHFKQKFEERWCRNTPASANNPADKQPESPAS